MHQERSRVGERSYFSPRLIKSPTAPHPSLVSLKGYVAKRYGNPCFARFPSFFLPVNRFLLAHTKKILSP